MSSNHNINIEMSDFNIKNINKIKIGVLVSEWNENITNKLKSGALETLNKNGIKETNIIIKYVPGSFELPLAAKYLIDYKNIDAAICLGCIIEGETKHFDYVCLGVTKGIMDLNTNTGVPVSFGVLTTRNLKQAEERAGGKHGNKGIESAIAVLKMLKIKQDLNK